MPQKTFPLRCYARGFTSLYLRRVIPYARHYLYSNLYKTMGGSPLAIGGATFV